MLNLRAHHLLCLPRFRGSGYSEAFTANMAEIAHKLRANPLQAVKVIDTPDDICRCCPHLISRQCEHDEEQIRQRDRLVLALLGLEAGVSREYSLLAQELHALLESTPLEQCCANCSWLDFCLGFAEA